MPRANAADLIATPLRADAARISGAPAGKADPVSDLAFWVESNRKRVRDWLLAILRYAVTLDESDLAAVMAIAERLDGAGSNIERIGFCFFSKASAEFCSAIVDRDDPHAARKLERHVGRIDDLRLRRALEAAIDFGRPEPPSPVAKRKNREDLWKGLRQR